MVKRLRKITTKNKAPNENKGSRASAYCKFANIYGYVIRGERDVDRRDYLSTISGPLYLAIVTETSSGLISLS